ncbi:hypothetical protein ACFWJM_10065 [Streptomyces sp. NPDC127077]|uniref:hypothetical protein n=1 Tax=Streptomyces sp. NPDC127077 TaxID=3347131 RepID=UPI00365A1215
MPGAQTFAALSGAVPVFAVADAGPGAAARGEGVRGPVPAALLVTAVSTSALFLAAARMAPMRAVGVLTVGASGASDAAVPGAVGDGIALLSGVTRIHPSSVAAGASAAAEGRRSAAVSAPAASTAVRWAGGRVSVGRGPGRVLVACGVSRFVMVVPPR